MTVAEATVNAILRSEDIESLIEAGAPDNEYTSEAQSISNALVRINEFEVSEELIAGIIKSIWSQSFGLFYEEDLELRMPSFRNVARQILPSNTKSN